MFDEHVTQLFAFVPQDLPVVIAFLDVLLHDIKPFCPLFVKLLNELIVALLQPPNGDRHEQRWKAGGSDLIPEFGRHRLIFGDDFGSAGFGDDL
jgi:hypothetical protein